MSKRIRCYEAVKLLQAHSCCELCGDKRNLEVHHIIPVVCGGSDDVSNLVVVCGRCHARLTPKSELTKIGLRKSTKQLGRKQGDKLITKKSVDMKPIIKRLSKDFDGNLSDKLIMQQTGLARNTYYKYKRELLYEN